MMFGKRAEMKRTTSMTEFALDFSRSGEALFQPLDRQIPAVAGVDRTLQRRSSADFVQTAPFLRACSLCRRRLIPGRDVYMYRGDSAFCSVECRQQQMSQDDRKEKCSLAMASNQEPAATAAAAAGSQVSATG
ncbi:FCS-Like Zinc finger 6-like [Andrographis paniculata]|uniref:FCS-Like Zinc finger 6-like n=1 Tax=Andrographis paniculata TaxID=175694 RepID=UPI0021E8F16E|nr:FCS-Like Zinc finger 6-like [Andrographis paniculata]